MYLVETGEPFTGCLKETFEGSEQIRGLAQFKDGKRYGLLVDWHANGTMAESSLWEGNIPVGKHTQWYENGQKRQETFYKEGRKDGTEIRWHENGNKSSEATYQNGELVGKEIRWGENGKSTTVSTQAEEQELNQGSPGEHELPSEPDAPPEVTCPENAALGFNTVIKMQSAKRPGGNLQYELRVSKLGGRSWTLNPGKPIESGQIQTYQNNFTTWGTGTFTVQARSSNGTAWTRWSEPQVIFCTDLLPRTKKSTADPTARLEQIIDDGLSTAVERSKLQSRDSLLYVPETNTLYRGWVKQSFDSGQISALQHFKDGKVDGCVFSWHPNGQKRGSSIVRDGKQDGHWITWYDTGQKKAGGAFADGKREGTQIEWYSNGQKKSETTYKDGKQVGEGTRWDEDGNVISE